MGGSFERIRKYLARTVRNEDLRTFPFTVVQLGRSFPAVLKLSFRAKRGISGRLDKRVEWGGGITPPFPSSNRAYDFHHTRGGPILTRLLNTQHSYYYFDNEVAGDRLGVRVGGLCFGRYRLSSLGRKNHVPSCFYRDELITFGALTVLPFPYVSE